MPRGRIFLLCCLSCCGGIEPTACPVHPNVNGKKDKKEKRKKDNKEKSEQIKKDRNEQKKKVEKEKQIEIETPQKQSLLQRLRHRLSRKKTTDQKAMSDQKQGHGISLSQEKLSTGSPRNKDTGCSVAENVHSDMQTGDEVLSASETGAIHSEARQTGQEHLDEECKDSHFDSLKEDSICSNTDAGCSLKAQEKVNREEKGTVESKTEQSVTDSLEEIIDNSEGNVNECIEGIYHDPPKAANDNSIGASNDNKTYDQQETADEEKEGESDWEMEF